MPHVCPPASNAVGRESRRVVVNPHAHPPLIVENVADTVGVTLPSVLS
jgi:hypothetical protein